MVWAELRNTTTYDENDGQYVGRALLKHPERVKYARRSHTGSHLPTPIEESLQQLDMASEAQVACGRRLPNGRQSEDQRVLQALPVAAASLDVLSPLVERVQN